MLQNLEIEEALIGFAMTDQGCAERVSELPEDAFSFAETQNLAKIIRDLVRQHQTPDLVTVMGYLLPQDTGSRTVAMKSQGLAISTRLYDQYELNALDLRRRRVMKAKCAELLNRLNDLGESTEDMAAEMQTAIAEVEIRSQSVSMMDAMRKFVDTIDQKIEQTMTGIAGFDQIAGGLQPGMMVVLGARPGVGKTALALSMATFIAEKSGPVLMVSLEMGDQEIIQRIVAAQSGVNMQKLVNHKVDAEDWGTIWGQSGLISQLPIRFSMAGSPLKIRREAKAMLQKEGLKMIVIDYLQLLRADEKCKSRYEEVSQISREIKLMAMELQVPVLALTQFNRNSETGNLRPTMADARDSGSIEQDANIFLVQWAPKDVKSDHDFYDYWDSCQRRGTEFQVLEIAKNRQGPVGVIPLEFDKPHMRFVTMSKE